MAIVFRRDFVHGKSRERCSRGIGAMRGRGHEDPRTFLAARRDGRANGQQPAQFAMGASLRAHRDRGHGRQRRKPAHQLGDEHQRALCGLLRLQWVEIAETREPRHLLVETRIVLHRARAERIEAGVDRIVHARQAHIVADNLWLRQSREPNRPLAAQIAQRAARYFRRRNIDAADARAAELEEQRFLMVEPTVARNRRRRRRGRSAGRSGASDCVHRHDRHSASESANALASSSVVVSVAATISNSRATGSCGIRRDAGTPPRMLRSAR